MNTADSICAHLESSDRSVKIGALKNLRHYCEDPATIPAQRLNTFNESYLHILKCYSDRYESVRNEAALTVGLYIQKLPSNDFHLLNIISTLGERMGKQEIVEESEEIRLLYVSQLNSIVQQCISNGNVRFLEESYSEIVKILIKSLRDPFPAVQREACDCVKKLAIPAETCSFQKWAEELAKPLYSMLNHKHSQSRIASIQALSRLGLHIDSSSNALSQLFTEVSPLLMDSMPLVRRECGMMGVIMLLELRDRYSYFDRIIPLVLCCLKDESPEVRDYIQPLWIKCGKQYFLENEMELNKQELVELRVQNYPEGVRRPDVGCRALVQRSLRLLKLITRESSDWKENVRFHSLKLLYQFVLHAEAAMTAKFFEIYPDVARACCDTQSNIQNEAVKVADLMGRLFSYDDWCEHGFDGLSKNANAGYLKCFYYMFTAATGVRNQDVFRVSSILIQPEFSQSLKPDVQLYVIKLVQTLLEKSEYLNNQELVRGTISGNDATDLFKNAYIATIKVMALSLDRTESNSAVQKGANDILVTIARCKGVKLSEVHEEYFLNALEYVQNLDAPLDSLSEPIQLLHGLLSICKYRSSYLTKLQSKINEVWQFCADDAKVKIFSTVSIAMLSWSETISLEVSESAALLMNFVQSVVEQHLAWKAGAHAEAMRSLATATLCAITQGAKLEACYVLPTLAKFFPNLLEDQSVATRNYALKCLYNFGEVKVEELKAIAYAALQRFDDPSANIRVLAATVIPKLSPKFENNQSQDNHDYRIWKTFIRKALEILFLHFEACEIRLKMAIKASLLQLAHHHTDEFKEYYKRSYAMAYDTSTLEELRKELPFEL